LIRKIGFTNRTLWAEYGVYSLLWGYVHDSTVRDLGADALEVSLSGSAEPRIEPEIVASPSPEMDEEAPIRWIDWFAHGFEIVQSIFPNGSFRAADTVAAYGLNGKLFVGPRHSVLPRRDKSARELSRFEIDLFLSGAAADGLDGPLFALHHLVETLAQDPLSPPLAAGEIVTTETLTHAFPVAAGEEWTTKARLKMREFGLFKWSN
jgi:2-oxo-3-hexenedioate decarboxylase